MTRLSRRQFFLALGASAVAAGATLPTGLPALAEDKLSHRDLYNILMEEFAERSKVLGAHNNALQDARKKGDGFEAAKLLCSVGQI
ncbi:MAG: hypothetical protein ACR2PW_04775 [Gammaproteobacteria bacterium]